MKKKKLKARYGMDTAKDVEEYVTINGTTEIEEDGETNEVHFRVTIDRDKLINFVRATHRNKVAKAVNGPVVIDITHFRHDGKPLIDAPS